MVGKGLGSLTLKVMNDMSVWALVERTQARLGELGMVTPMSRVLGRRWIS